MAKERDFWKKFDIALACASLIIMVLLIIEIIMSFVLVMHVGLIALLVEIFITLYLYTVFRDVILKKENLKPSERAIVIVLIVIALVFYVSIPLYYGFASAIGAGGKIP